MTHEHITDHTLLQPAEAFILDSETTGIGSKAQAVEIASLSLNPLEEYTSRPFFANSFHSYIQRFKPDVPIHPEAQKVHGITLNSLADCKPFQSFYLPECSYFLAHNAQFDAGILSNYCIRTRKRFILGKPRKICTLTLAKKLWKREEVGNFKLTTLIKELVIGGAGLLEESHTALGDCKLTLILLSHILDRLPEVETWEDLWLEQEALNKQNKQNTTNSEDIMQTLRWGVKHFGVPFKDVPKDYLRWMLQQIHVKGNLRKSCEYWVKTKE
jgi:DNA polymerase III epsilon subunit-like protein